MSERQDERQDRPVSRDETLFTIEMALFKARRLWPKRREPGDHDRLKPMALAIANHIELCGMRLVGKVPRLGSSTTHFLGAGRKKSPDGGDGD